MPDTSWLDGIANKVQQPEQKSSWLNSVAEPIMSSDDRGSLIRESMQWTDKQKDDFTKFRKKLNEQRGYLSGVGSPTLAGGLEELGFRVTSMLARATFQDEAADALNRQASAVSQARQEAVQKRYDEGGPMSLGIHPNIANAGAGMLNNIPPMVVAGAVAGPYGAVAQGAAQTGNIAITEGRDSGLSGGKLTRYVGTQAALEGTIGAVLNRVGLGGAESLAGGKAAIAKTMPQLLKKVGIQVGAEEVEEVTTEVLQALNDKYHGVDDSKFSWDEFKQIATQTTLQTLGTMGVLETPHVASNVQAIKSRNAIIEASENGIIPSRKEWKQWGLPEGDGRSTKQRASNIHKYAKDLVEEDTSRSEAQQESVASEAVDESVSTEKSTSKEEDFSDVADRIEPVRSDDTDGSGVPLEENPEVTSTKASIRDHILRKGRGLAPVDQSDTETVQGWLDEAYTQIKNDPESVINLVDDIIKNPQNISPVEHSMLQLRYRLLHNKMNEAVIARDGAKADIERADALREINNITSSLQKVEEASKLAGVMWGRSGVAQQIELMQDYSPAALIRKATIAKGSPLTDAEIDSVNAVSKEVTEMEANADKRVEVDTQSAQDASINSDISVMARKVRRKGAVSMRKTEAQIKARKALEEFKSLLSGNENGSVKKFIAGEEGSLNVDLLSSAMNVARAYIQLGNATFSEFVANMKYNAGIKIDDVMDTLTEAWNSLRSAGEVTDLDIDKEDTKSIAKEAKRLQRSLVEAGATNLDEVVDGVVTEMQKAVPGITAREVKDILSGYGKYRPLSRNRIDAVIRDINGQLQQLSKIEDMIAGIAPKKTGNERRTPSDAERQLTKLVNELKKKGGFTVVDRDSQLKSALEAAKTYTRNRIKDLTAEISSGKRVINSRTVLIPDSELTLLRNELEELKKVHGEKFPKERMTEQKKIAMAIRAVDASIKTLEDQIKSGDVSKKGKKPLLSSPELDAKRAKLNELRSRRDELRNIDNPKLTKEQRSLIAYRSNLQKRLADYQDRIAREDYEKAKRPIKIYDKETTRMRYEVEQAKVKFREMEDAWKRKNMKWYMKALRVVPDVLQTSRAILTSYDMSAVLRQGGWVAASHPILAMKAVPAMFKAAASKEGQFMIMNEIRNRENSQIYEQVKLAITTTSGRLTKQEEAYMGRFSEKIPGVALSERAYVTYLNRLRADLFDTMYNNLAKDGDVTLDQARIIAKYVNTATGRGSLGGLEPAAVTAATILFAPRFVASRFQLLLGTPMWTSDMQVRHAIRNEYARTLTTLGVFVSSVLLAAGMYDDDDPNKPKLELDSRSSDFMKLRIGNTRIDLMGGISQVTVLLSRIATGSTKTTSGKVVALSGDTAPYGGSNEFDVAGRFLRTKMAPWLGTFWDWKTGKNVVGEKVTTGSLVAGATMPLAFRDVYETMKEQGVPEGVAYSLLGVFGAGLQNYSPRPHRKKRRRSK